MKKVVSMLCLLFAALMLGAPAARAQGAQRGPDQTTIRDAELERDSKHNLEVAQQYFKLRKAYRAALARTEEIIVANPTFSKIDEALYIAGMSSLYLSENRGKQKLKPEDSPEKFRANARGYLTQLVRDFPDSAFHSEAEEALRALGGPLEPKTENAQP